MGRIIVPVTITNVLDPTREIVCLGLVDTGSTGLVLPSQWKELLGNLDTVRVVSMETADQRVVRGEVCGPVRVEIEGFPPVMTEVTFLEMKPVNGDHEPLIGYIVLEQSQAAIDMVGHRLVKVPYVDLKRAAA
jgi:predicted aspartyl protease